ncbi:hypothetical protein MKW92_031599 [Papaver armeniacum]|nr:hypothetical protein MKW92_031599 [Papaver armeniacum]
MKGYVISFLMVLVAITSLQISHTVSYQDHDCSSKIVQNLRADGIRICLVIGQTYRDKINSSTYFSELSRGDGYFDALIEIKIGVRNILEDALGVDLYDEFDHINMDKES